MSTPSPEQVEVLLRECPTCGAVAAELCRKDTGGHHGLHFTHKARQTPGRAERQAAKQAEYTARYRAKKAAAAKERERKRGRRKA